MIGGQKTGTTWITPGEIFVLLRRHDLAEVQRRTANTKVGNTDLACTKAEFDQTKWLTQLATSEMMGTSPWTCAASALLHFGRKICPFISPFPTTSCRKRRAQLLPLNLARLRCLPLYLHKCRLQTTPNSRDLQNRLKLESFVNWTWIYRTSTFIPLLPLHISCFEDPHS